MRDSQKNVDEILTESRAIMKEDFFKEHERDHFRGRIELIGKRNKELDEKVTQAERRYFVLKIDIDFFSLKPLANFLSNNQDCSF